MFFYKRRKKMDWHNCFFPLADPVWNDKQQMTCDWDNGGFEVPLLDVMYWWELLRFQFPYSNRIRISVIFVHFSSVSPGMDGFLGNWAKQAVEYLIILEKVIFQIYYFYTTLKKCFKSVHTSDYIYSVSVYNMASFAFSMLNPLDDISLHCICSWWET